jgi:ComF family protein
MRAMQLLDHVMDFCYPGACANCDAPAAGGNGAILCDQCGGKLDELISAAACHACAKPLASAGAPCPYCHGRGMAPYDRIVRLGVFDEPLKNLIHEMKYHRRWQLAEMLADRLCATERAKGLLIETEVLVPVPLHFIRQFQRGYNQADVIARRVGSRRNSHGIAVIPVAKRTRNTETQTHLHSDQKRHMNLRGAFALRRCGRKIQGRHVLVIDDVMTTGATLKSLGRLLKKAKPASLSAMIIAIADPKRRGFEAI